MGDESTTQQSSGLAEYFNEEYYAEFKKTIEQTLKKIADGEYEKRLMQEFDAAVQKLVKGFEELKKDAITDLAELYGDFLEALNTIEAIMDPYIEHMENAFENAKKETLQNYEDIERWWKQESSTFGRYMDLVFDAVGNIVQTDGNPNDYKRVVFIPTTYELTAEPVDPGLLVKVLRGGAKAAEWAVKEGIRIVNPASGIWRHDSEDVDTRILFYKNHPPLVNPWLDGKDDQPQYAKEKPLEFPLALPFGTVIPITICRRLPTKLFFPFMDRKYDNKQTKVALQFLFSKKLYQDTNWIWLFLDELDAKDKEIERHGFGWYMQGRFYQDRSFMFSLENRFFIDTVSMKFNARDSQGRTLPTIEYLEPNITRNLLTRFVIDGSDYEVTSELRANPIGIVGRKVEVNASISAEIQEIIGGEFSLGVKAELPTPLTTMITKVGDEMIKDKVIESAKQMTEALERAYGHLEDSYRVRCDKSGCDGVGAPVGYVTNAENDQRVRNYRCSKCKETFNAKESDDWDRLVSSVYAVGNYGAALAHFACVIAKTAWAMLEVVVPMLGDAKTTVGIDATISPQLGAAAGGAELAELEIGVKFFDLSGPVEMLKSKQDWMNIADLAGRILINVGLQIYEDFKQAWNAENAFVELINKARDLAFKPGEFFKYFLKAIPPAMAGMNDQAWVRKAYQDVTIGIGVDAGAKVMPTFFGKFGVGVKPVGVGLECNLGAFCPAAKGIDNHYKLGVGNGFRVKLGGSIPYVVGKADADIGVSFPLKVAKVHVKTKDSLFY